MSQAHIPVNKVSIEGNLQIPKEAKGLVIFSHGSGSSRFSPRNKAVAKTLQESGLGTLLLDLLTPEEDQIYENRFDIDLLTDRLLYSVNWLKKETAEKKLNIGIFGSSTGAASALSVAAQLGRKVSAVVSRGGRPDLVMEVLEKVISPTLLIVGGEDEVVIELNKEAYEKLQTIKALEIIPGATHLFEEPGALEEVARLTSDWFKKYL